MLGPYGKKLWVVKNIWEKQSNRKQEWKLFSFGVAAVITGFYMDQDITRADDQKRATGEFDMTLAQFEYK